MSSIKAILPEGYGMPLAWLYTPSGDVLRDTDNTPITKYLEEFEYEYAEEEDDTCILTFKLPNASTLDLPYFQQDVVLHVQWGFLINSGKLIQSPIRKVAIRDLQTKYGTDGISLTLECTDLVAYLKGFRTNTLRSNSRDLKISRAVNKSEDNFMNWLKEISEDNFTVTYTKGKNVQRIDLAGRMQNAEQDLKTGRFRVAVDNARVQTDQSIDFKVGKVIKGKSKTLTQAIKDQLELQADLEGSSSGKPILDSTDNNIHIKQRNYDQPIFKTFIWAGGTGELLKFTSDTNTRATKEDSATSTAVDPYKKQVVNTTVESADMSKNEFKDIGTFDIKKHPITGNERTALLDKPAKPREEVLEGWLGDARKVHEHNIKNPLNQKELPDLRYVINKEFVNDPVMGTQTSPIFVKIPSRQVLNSPDFIALNQRTSNEIKARYRKATTVGSNVVEKIQRKYEATLETIGDPSLIKGKVINVTGLSRLDNGKWYITRARHSIKIGQGYLTTLELLKKPKTINLSAKTMATNPKYDENKDEVYWPVTSEETLIEVFKENPPQTQEGTKLDDVEINTEFKTEESGVIDIERRIDYLNAEEDYLLHKDVGLEPMSRDRRINTGEN